MSQNLDKMELVLKAGKFNLQVVHVCKVFESRI